MDASRKIARTIRLHGKEWLINGTWSAGGRYPKSPNMQKTAKEELFDVQHTSYTWLDESEQVGWFEFLDKPENGHALAPIVLRQIKSDNIPWHGIFRVESGWWIVAVDDAMALHPLWDVFVSEDDFSQFYAENSPKWMTFPFGIQLNTVEETEDWLFDNNTSAKGSKVSPIIAFKQAIKQFSILIIVLSILILISGVAYHFWEIHEEAIAHRKELLELAQEKLNAEVIARQKKITKQELLMDEKHIENTWQDWPRPWVNPISWGTFINKCENSFSGVNHKNGWSLTNIECKWSAKNPKILTITKIWNRGVLSSVLHLPEKNGTIENQGNIFNQIIQLNVPWKSVSSHRNMQAKYTLPQMKNHWLGESQIWKSVISISTGTVQTFLAPIPKGTPPKVAKSLHPPVLWRSFPVIFSSSYSPNHWYFWKNKDFIPSLFSYSLNNNVYSITGVQYVQ